MKSWVTTFPLLLLLFCLSWQAHAAQEAYVTADKAIIYADRLMTSPLGFVPRGKKIKVGDIPRNNAQVYPIVVSGRVAYIKVADVSTEKASVDSNQLVAERFTRKTSERSKNFYSLSYLNYSSAISLDKEPGLLKNNDSLSWQGVSLRGGVLVSKRWDLQVVMNYLEAEESRERFTAFEFGGSGGLRIIESKRFIVKWMIDALAIPFSNYAQGTLFRINGHGFTAGTGIGLNYRLGKYWGLTGMGGFYHSRIFGLNLPKGFDDISPTFTGSRLSLGLSYYY